MKKLIAVIAALTLALCGCSSGAADNGTGLAIDVPEGAELFDNIMGLKGYVVNVSEAGGEWYERVYHADMDGVDVVIGESFGYGDPADYIVDLYGDGVPELVCNCTFGGDGVQRVYVYQLVDGAVQVGTIVQEDWTEGYTGPGTAIAEAYLPDDECFTVSYPGADGNPVESFFSVDDLVWNAYEPSEG